MRPSVIKPPLRIKGKITLPGDKSIAHRSIIISALCRGKTRIENFPTNKDCLGTLKAFKKLGIKITQEHLSKYKGSSVVTVFGKGLDGLKEPQGHIFVGDSGTTLRLILGVLAGQGFSVTLTAGKSLSQRPMLRVTKPLTMMGAKINARRKAQNAKLEEYPPITIKGGNLKPIAYKIPVASAQVKSAILLAGLYAKGATQVIEPLRTRDHTERILNLFRADIKVKQNKVVIKGGKELTSPKKIYIPGDISSASFFIVLASLLPNSQVLITKVSLNPSRIGVIKVLKRMGAAIKVTRSLPRKSLSRAESRDSGQAGRQAAISEPMGDLLVKSSKLKGVIVKKEEVPSLIDELPILTVAAANARGRTIFEGVEELRVKETDRIRSISDNLRNMGANIKILKTVGSEKIIITGIKELKGTRLRSFGDHRTAMSAIVAALKAKGKSWIDDITCINKSFPGFLSILKRLIR